MHKLRPARGARQPVECCRRVAFQYRMPSQCEHGFTELRRQSRITWVRLLPICRTHDGPVARRAHVEDDRLIAAAHANLVSSRLERHPFVTETVSLSRWVELLDKKILHIRSDVRESPAEPLVVADNDERNAGNCHSGYVHRVGYDVHLPPHRWHLDG